MRWALGIYPPAHFPAIRNGCAAPAQRSLPAWPQFAVAVLYLLVLLVTLLIGARPAVADVAVPQERERYEANLKALREKIHALRVKLDQARSKQDAVRAELRGTEQAISRTTMRLQALDGELADATRQLGALRADAKRHRADLRTHRTTLAGQLRAAYATGRQEYIKLLLNQEHVATVGRIVAYYDYFNRARVKRIDAIADTLQKQQTVEQAIVHKTEELERLRTEQSAGKRQLEAGRKARGVILAKLDREIRDDTQRLQRLMEDERRLNQLLEELQPFLSELPSELGDRQPFPRLKGALAWPSSGRLLARYGAPRKLGKLTWSGVLIGAQEGEGVHAVYHGRVAFADWLRGFGLLLIIDHGDGYMSLYGHNQGLHKNVGDWVEAGDIIASVGSSGGARRAGLYFEIRHNGKPTDPAIWCKSRRHTATGR